MAELGHESGPPTPQSSTQQNREAFLNAQEMEMAGTAPSQPAVEAACEELQEAGCSDRTKPPLLGKPDVKTRE